jgi:outer membrane protein assembly factor BamB
MSGVLRASPLLETVLEPAMISPHSEYSGWHRPGRTVVTGGLLAITLASVLAAQDKERSGEPAEGLPEGNVLQLGIEALQQALQPPIPLGGAEAVMEFGAEPVDEEEPEERQLDPTLTSEIAGSRTLQQLESFIARERWHDVIVALQGLVDGEHLDGDTFTRGEDGRWTSLERTASDRILSLPEGGRQAYLKVFSQLATDLLAQARASGDLQRVAEIARRFSATPAGREATLELALAHFDRGEYLASERWFDRLSATERDRLPEAVLLRYLAVLRFADREQEATRLLQEHQRRLTASGVPAASQLYLREWWDGFSPAVPPDESPRADWPMPFGNARHNGRLAASAPVLLERWSATTTSIESVREQMRTLQSDLSDAGRGLISATSAISVRDLTALRTLRGIEVRNAATGELVWSEPFRDISEELLLSGLAAAPGGNAGEQRDFLRNSQYGETGDFDQHPLTSLLYHDTVRGSLTSDGQLLFAIANNAVLGREYQRQWFGQMEQQRDPFGRDWQTNQLVAFDVRTGRERWRVGGTRRGEAFDLPLAGCFFFGPPTPADRELFVIGEREGEVCLFTLDPATGAALDVQPLAHADADVEVDPVRRLWACSPTVVEGLVICPTTLGWIVAFDRTERRLLWAYGYNFQTSDSPQHRFNGVSTNTLLPLNSRWLTTPPVVQGRRVYYATQELPDQYHTSEPFLVCLDLATGAERWRQTKASDDLYFAGVVDDVCLVVGRSRVVAFDARDGHERWSTTLPTDAVPSGQGVVAGDVFWLPLTGGALWSLRCTTGEVTTRLSLSPGSSPLGNLLFCRGTLLSSSPLEMRGFHEQSVLDAEIAARRQRDPGDQLANVRQAQLHAMRGEHAAVVSTLSPLVDADVSISPEDELLQQSRQLLVQSLTAIVSEDLQARDAEFELLSRLTGDPLNPDLIRLEADRALAREDWNAAWRALARAREADYGSHVEDGDVSAAPEVWLAGRLAKLFDRAPPDLQAQLSEAFATWSAESPPVTGAIGRDRLEMLLDFHSVGRQRAFDIAQAAHEAGRWGAAEVRWRRLALTPDPETAIRAQARLSAMLGQLGHLDDAFTSLQQGEADWSALGESFTEIVRADLRRELDEAQAIVEQARTASLAAMPPEPDWIDTTYELVASRRSGQQMPVGQVVAEPADAPFLRDRRVEFDPQTQRLRWSSADRTREYWSLPLRTPSRQMYQQAIGMRVCGLQTYVVSQGMVHGLSLSDRSLLWTHAFDERSAGGRFVVNAQVNSNFAMAPAEFFLQQRGVERGGTSTGLLAAANARAVLLHGRRDLTALDPLTGSVLWTREGVDPDADVRIDNDWAYVLGTGAEPLMLSLLDGRRVANPVLERRHAEAALIGDGQVVVVRHNGRGGFFGLVQAPLVIEALDLESGDVRWSHRIAPQSRLGWIDADTIARLEPDGHLASINLRDGTLRELGQLSAAPARTALIESYPRHEVQLLADGERLFLFVDREFMHHITYFGTPSLRLNGDVACFARDGSGLLWSTGLANQQMLLDQWRLAPVLVFVNQESDESFYRIRVAVVDKASGRVLFEANERLTQSPLSTFSIDLAKRIINLGTYNLQVEVRPLAVKAESPAEE